MDYMQKLNTVRFSNMQNWSILSHLTVANYQSKHKHIKIGAFLKRIKESVVIQDDVYYKRATIKINNGGVFLRDTVLGKNIGTKNQFIIKKGQLLLSKIDARNGAFGIVPEELDNGVITGNFWTYEIDTTKIFPQILSNILSSKRFQEIWEACSNGTTNRHYLQEADFLNTSIPVPSLSEQAEILAVYNSKMAEANAMQYKHSYNEIENEIEKYLQLQAYANIDSNENLSFINYSDCLTWDVRNKQQRVFISSKYKQQALSKVAQINPTIRKNILDEEDVSFIPMECVSDLDGEVKKKRSCKASAKGFTKFEEGDIIWAKITPCMQNGKSAIVRGLTNGIGYGSTEFYVIRVNETVVVPEYIYYLLRMHRVRETAVNHFSGSAGQQRVRKSFLEELSIPVPSLEEQKVLVITLNNIKREIIINRTKVDELIRQAQKDFENAIFGE